MIPTRADCQSVKTDKLMNTIRESIIDDIVPPWMQNLDDGWELVSGNPCSVSDA